MGKIKRAGRHLTAAASSARRVRSLQADIAPVLRRAAHALIYIVTQHKYVQVYNALGGRSVGAHCRCTRRVWVLGFVDACGRGSRFCSCMSCSARTQGPPECFVGLQALALAETGSRCSLALFHIPRRASDRRGSGVWRPG